MPPTLTVHVVIRGRVQGVGYRAWTHHQAELRGLEGWVRNRRDGSVEAIFSGLESAIQAMLKACREGPAGSRVEEVEVRDGDPASIGKPGSGHFEVLATL